MKDLSDRASVAIKVGASMIALLAFGLFVLGGLIGLLVIGWRALFG